MLPYGSRSSEVSVCPSPASQKVRFNRRFGFKSPVIIGRDGFCAPSPIQGSALDRRLECCAIRVPKDLRQGIQAADDAWACFINATESSVFFFTESISATRRNKLFPEDVGLLQAGFAIYVLRWRQNYGYGGRMKY